jgi:DNA-directed RNA polymerase subunit omega
MYRIPERIDSTFRYVLIAARRAEQLMRGARPKIDLVPAKPTRIALREVTEELLDWDYGPAPQPEPEPVEAAENAAEEAPA